MSLCLVDSEFDKYYMEAFNLSHNPIGNYILRKKYNTIARILTGLFTTTFVINKNSKNHEVITDFLTLCFTCKNSFIEHFNDIKSIFKNEQVKLNQTLENFVANIKKVDPLCDKYNITATTIAKYITYGKKVSYLSASGKYACDIGASFIYLNMIHPESRLYAKIMKQITNTPDKSQTASEMIDYLVIQGRV